MAIYFSTEGRTEDIAELETVMGGNFDIRLGGAWDTFAEAEQQFSDAEYERALDIFAQAVATGLSSDLRLVLGDGDSVMLVKSEGIS